MGKAKSAEKLVSMHCSDIDATASIPDDDANGWDLFVQFPHKPFEGDPELRPARAQAYVQVKSTVGRRSYADIKLSNVQEPRLPHILGFF